MGFDSVLFDELAAAGLVGQLALLAALDVAQFRLELVLVLLAAQALRFLVGKRNEKKTVKRRRLFF